MPRILFLALALVSALPLQAVENIPSSSFNLSPPNSNNQNNIPNWTSGWAQPDVQPVGYTSTTGWNYVGSVGGNSAVYMGNNWVLTAAHVGFGSFYLNGVTYPAVAGTAHPIGTADLVLFQIGSAPDLPGVPVRSSPPPVPSGTPPNQSESSPVAIIGWGAGGGNRNETWGYNNPINYIGQPINLTSNGVSYSSTDFVTLTQTTGSPAKETGNPYELQVGDSGGAIFIYNSTAGRWELAGINEATSDGNTYEYPDGTTGSYSLFVQLSVYYSSIETLIGQPLPTDTPTMPLPAVPFLAGLLLVVGWRSIRQANRHC